MTKSRPTYSTEFKRDTAELVIKSGYTIAGASEATGAGYTAVRRWVNQLKGESSGMTPSAKAITPEHKRIQTLEARIEQIEWENEILKRLPLFWPGTA